MPLGKAGYSDKVVIGMDVAASEFYRWSSMTWTEINPMTPTGTSHPASWPTCASPSSGTTQVSVPRVAAGVAAGAPLRGVLHACVTPTTAS